MKSLVDFVGINSVEFVQTWPFISPNFRGICFRNLFTLCSRRKIRLRGQGVLDNRLSDVDSLTAKAERAIEVAEADLTFSAMHMKQQQPMNSNNKTAANTGDQRSLEDRLLALHTTEALKARMSKF